MGVRSALLVGVAALALSACVGGTYATVTSWSVGSSHVTGTVHNGEGRGCSDMWVTLNMRDRNGAIVRSFDFGVGEVADGADKIFATDVVGLFGQDAPVDSNVVTIDATAQCQDKT